MLYKTWAGLWSWRYTCLPLSQGRRQSPIDLLVFIEQFTAQQHTYVLVIDQKHSVCSAA